MRYTSKFWMFFLLFWVGLGQLQAQTELQPLPVDPKVRYGKLSNGLTYYIRHNELPKDRADFYIAQNVGSILEEENQRGLAHFLEHMAFQGTKNFPGKGSCHGSVYRKCRYADGRKLQCLYFFR